MFCLRGRPEDDIIWMRVLCLRGHGPPWCCSAGAVFIIETYKLKCYISINNIILASGLQSRWKKCSNEPFHWQHLLLRMALDLAPTGICRE